ncbi:MAG: beta-propeller domain-containing protein [Clostridia bacterium]|nr:beta-propeller domain-containing protein [Clostridia bacterium]
MRIWEKHKILISALICTMIVGIFTFVNSGIPIVNAMAGGDPELTIQKRLNNAIVLYTGSSLSLVNNEELQVDKENVEVVPFVKNGRVLVPLRFISENLQANVVWDKDTSAVTLTVGKKNVKFLPGNSVMVVNGKDIKIDVSPEIINGRTFVPIRAITEAFGKKVFYDRGLIIIGDDKSPFDKETEKTLLDTVVARVNNLPTVGSYENLKNLLAEANAHSNDYRYRMKSDMAFDEVEVMNNIASNSQKEMSKSVDEATDYSETNVQVQGVDEADIVKTDGEYIYQVNKGRVIVCKAYPAEEMEVVSTLDFTDENYQPQEIYIDKKYLVVIGTSRHNGEYPVIMNGIADGVESKRIYPRPNHHRDSLKALIYDIKDKTNITKLREVEVDGRYLSSRKIGSYLYLIANNPIEWYSNQKEEDYLPPTFRDTAFKDEAVAIPYKDMCYIPPITQANYLVIAGIDLESNDEAAQISTYLGAGENIYVSQENLFIALSKRENEDVSIQQNNMKRIAPRYRGDSINTMVYKFSLDKGKVTYLSKGEVPGTLLNQFSMDEHKKHLRIATTKGNIWGSGNNQSQNNVYILDESMSIVGRIEGIAPGEKIYSSRFMGDRAYLVTFKDTDPLFVLDLKEPQNPRILGALKIPGYSDYLHPYDENHIIGIGKDTIEIPYKDREGNVIDSNAYYQGMKLAVFDVTDVKNPKEMFKEIIGDRGTDSELLRNHKALLFDKEKELLTFPVTVMEIQGEKIERHHPQYGQFAFQGAYIYKLNLEDGFKLRGKITHLTDEDTLKAGYRSYNSGKAIKRIMYIKDVLYTLSDDIMKAHGFTGLEERKELKL